MANNPVVGYKRKDIQILGGGLNLLPPGDKTPITDYLLAQNWRPDRLGKLVSRFGNPQKFSTAGAGLAHSAAIHGGINGDYYVGCNDSFTTPTGKLYFNFGAGAIATGFDGNRIGMAAMNGWMWFMNRAKQGRHKSGGSFEAWGIVAPSASCTAAGAATPGVTASATYTYTLQSNPAYVHYLTIAGVSYSFLENGYSAGQIPLVIASLASADPNCSVTYSGSGSNVVITPIIPNTLFALSGSDGNAAASVATGAVSSLPNGTYQYYYTYATSDDSMESNPSPVSAVVTVVTLAITLSGVTVSGDSRVGKRNIYASGGTLQAPYLVGTIPDNSTTTITISLPDLEATNNGQVMPTNNDLPPLASGVVGPHFNRLFAFSTVANVNRLFYTEPGTPQYWPGSRDPAVGNWVDVGMEGEAIVWCTVHANLLVVYKERSIWMLVGPPDTGYLQCVRDGLGLAGQFAVAPAGVIDYFVGPNNLYMFDMDRVAEMGGAIQPLFNASTTNTGPTTPIGSILPASAFNSTSTYPYAVALGYALGKLYIGFAEQASGTQYCLLVYHEDSQRWFYQRSGVSGVTGYFGFLFDGQQMVGLTGTAAGGAAQGYNLDDFRSFFVQDTGGIAIQCVYQSHFENCGLPDNQKKWLEAVFDFEFAGDTATVTISYDNGANINASAYSSGTTYAVSQWATSGGVTYQSLQGTNLNHTPASSPTWWMAVANSPGTLTGTGRLQTSIALGTDGVLAKNISVLISSSANHLLILHNIFLYYYEEARLANAASTIPLDLGSPKVKQCKELQLDIDATGGNVAVNLYSDLPGNALAVRQTPVVTANSGRAVMKFPFSVTEGFLWRLALTGSQFRLYSARLLMRAIGTYVEAYEAAAGFAWDSMPQTFDSGITHVPRGYGVALASLPIKRAREISLQIDTFNANVTYTFLSDLPGNAMASRQTGTINSGSGGRRFLRIPLPGGTNAPIEGRMFQLQLSGASKFILYEAAVEILPVGVYIEAYEAAGGAVYDSRETDFNTPAVKEARELELDIETSGTVTVGVLSDLTTTFASTASTSGRAKVMIPLTVNAALEQFVEGRYLRLLLTGTVAYRLYGARILVRQFGTYLTASEAAGGALWDTTDLDLGTQGVKQISEIDLDIWAYGSYTVTVYTNLPGNAMASRATSAQSATSGRAKVRIPLQQGGVPDNYYFGRLVRVTVTSAAAFKIFGARINARPIGVYVETYEATGGAVWDSTPSDLGSPNDKTFDQVRFEIDTDGAASVAVYTDLPGEAFSSRGSFSLTGGATGRHWATVPLSAGIEGRSIRLVVSSASGFRVYRAQVLSRRVGRYLAAAQPAGNDVFNTLEFDFQSERMKLYKKLEIDARADGTLAVTVLTNQGVSGAALATVVSANITTNGRETFTVPATQGIRGRLLRISMTSTAAARIYRVRVWSRPLNEPNAQWAWESYPVEESDILPTWADLPVEATPPAFSWATLPVPPTKPEWDWAPFPVNPTEPQWFWARFLSVEETPDTWDFVDVPFEVM